MKASDAIAGFLAAQGVDHVFELVGGMITHLVDSIGEHGRTRIVSVHHEQAASFAADAVGRMTGVPGVAMATSGPGATNLLTGMGSCYFDSSPAVFITGQVNRSEQRGTRQIRQLGFQETDIVAMAAPVSKMARLVNDPDELIPTLRSAFEAALSGRPGPVLVDIPMDVQRVDIEPGPFDRVRRVEEPLGADATAFVDELIDRIASAERPLVLVGGGVRAAGAIGPFREFVERLGVPVVSSLLGVDALPFLHRCRVGMIGSYGNRWANQALGRSDLLVVLGSRLDVRQTGSQTDSFREGREVYHVDCEAGELNNRVTGCHVLRAQLAPFLSLAAEAARVRRLPDRPHWLEEITAARTSWPDTAELKGIRGINPNALMHALSARSGAASAFVADVGQHQMWAAQSLELGADQRFLTSGGMGAMGFALPAAIGAAFAEAGRPAVMIAGDGGFQLNLQELETIRRNDLPVKMVIVNNRCHGMVRQFQQSYFDERYQSTYWGYSAPDFAAVAAAYGVASRRVEDPGEARGALEALWRDPLEPFLLEVMVDTFANAYPKLAFGRPITEMEPFAKPLDMEGT
ncbi:thiamine pyrophosphate-binding protein [Tautonia plasticadhaerens]|uniref:Acetolactate synthase large subunit n=1 Tax=Tautonia plasticadhaerens TaxID=2527974 RepID=A0A518H3P0_9BACT|nr:thiamine pyrophosphate-binding protein [Tautonia plasticadhaerens]QDV35471.1 Acetolactate synthase large subunit [Tautonia plasticadhaerens]